MGPIAPNATTKPIWVENELTIVTYESETKKIEKESHSNSISQKIFCE